MATVVLTVVGTVLGGPIGAAIGATIGQVIDNTILFAPKGRQGPRLSDLRLQTSRYGDQVPKLFGTMRVAGSVIWATDLKERRHKKGGGKGQPKVTTYSYSASFAVALSARRIVSVGRIWADGNLLRGAAGDFKTALGAFRLHDGSEDQPLDPLIAADKGSGTTPAHRGIAYAVFEDLQLADYGNRIPSLTFEIVADSGAVAIVDMAHELSGGAIANMAPSAAPSIAGYAAFGGTVADALSPLVDGLGIALRSDASALSLSWSTASEAVLAADLVGASFNGKEERGQRTSRARAEDVPIRLTIRHYDPARDYQSGVQTAERAGAGRKDANLDLPAVLDAAVARSLAETRLQSLWTGRSGIELRCDWRALTAQPGAVVTLEGENGRWRIEQSEWEGIGVRLRLKQVGGNGVALPAASAGNPITQADRLHGATSLIVADLPVPGDDLRTTPVVVAAAAGTQAGWRAAELFVEDASTGGLTSLGITAPSATMGTVLTAPDASASPALFDMVSALDVQLLHDEMLLSNADDSSLLAGANAALVGQEAIQFGQAVQTGPTTWRLTRLLRGRRGTEWAMAGHVAGERFLLLDDQSLFAVPSAQAAMGAMLHLAAISIGDVTPAQASEVVTGQAVLPLSPAHLQAVQTGGDWQFGWVRRSRNGWLWNDGADAPLGEEQELYRISLVHGGGVFRTVETALPQWTYDATAIAADNGSGITGAVSFEVRQVGTYGVGKPVVTNFSI